MRILYNDAARAPQHVEESLGAEYVPFEQLLRESDFISIHVPLSAATRKLIGAPQLRMMKPTAILVNTARGPVVDEAALAEALREGVIGGAGLDVFEQEPAVHPGLLNLPQAVLAPHIGSASIDTRRKMSMMAENAVCSSHRQTAAEPAESRSLGSSKLNVMSRREWLALIAAAPAMGFRRFQCPRKPIAGAVEPSHSRLLITFQFRQSQRSGFSRLAAVCCESCKARLAAIIDIFRRVRSCGARTACGRFNNRDPPPVPARIRRGRAPMTPSRRASARAASSTTGPRAVLTRIAVGFIIPSWALR